MFFELLRFERALGNSGIVHEEIFVHKVNLALASIDDLDGDRWAREHAASRVSCRYRIRFMRNPLTPSKVPHRLLELRSWFRSDSEVCEMGCGLQVRV